MATRIDIQGLQKTFRRAGAETVAVAGVNLIIEPGEIFFLLGPSGCGKTTLLRTLAGFIEPNKGQILFDGVDVTTMPPHKREVGMVFQSYALWPHLSVLENVAFGLRVRHAQGDIEARSREALARVQMAPYAERKPNELSGGQQQRVALARALVVRPKVLLLDEPLSNLDAKLRADLRSEIRRMCKSAETTTVYVTHDQKEALSIADRIAVFRAGQVCQVGSPHQLYHQPKDPFVSGFLGEVNLVSGTLRRKSEREAMIETSFGVVRSQHPSAMGLSGAGPLQVGIRPEQISVSTSTASEFAISGIIQSSMFLGDSTQMLVRAGADTLRITAGAGAPSADGSQCFLTVDPAHVMCFEASPDGG